MKGMIHAAGFRDNTRELLKLCTLKMAEQIDRNILTYLRRHHTLDRMVLAGVGVPHDELVRLAERFLTEGSAIESGSRKFRPEGILRLRNTPEDPS